MNNRAGMKNSILQKRMKTVHPYSPETLNFRDDSTGRTYTDGNCSVLNLLIEWDLTGGIL